MSSIICDIVLKSADGRQCLVLVNGLRATGSVYWCDDVQTNIYTAQLVRHDLLNDACYFTDRRSKIERVLRVRGTSYFVGETPFLPAPPDDGSFDPAKVVLRDIGSRMCKLLRLYKHNADYIALIEHPQVVGPRLYMGGCLHLYRSCEGNLSDGVRIILRDNVTTLVVGTRVAYLDSVPLRRLDTAPYQVMHDYATSTIRVTTTSVRKDA